MVCQKICDKYDVTLDIAGHDHHYERSKVIYDKSVVYSGSDVPADVKGTTYIVTGGAGAPLRSVNSKWWTKRAVKKNHYCMLTAYDDRLEMKVKDIKGIVIDEYVIEKADSDDGGDTDSTLISNLSVASGGAYVIDRNLKDNDIIYGDRDYVFTDVGSYAGMEYIRTDNDDKNETDSSFITFKVKSDVNVYVAYDSRAVYLPDWLNDWSETGDLILTTDKGSPGLDVYSKTYSSGSTVKLGGNDRYGTGAESMYGVIIGEVSDDDPDDDPDDGGDSGHLSDYLSNGEVLELDQWLLSEDGRYKFKLLTNGNLVLRDTKTQKPIWKSGTANEPASHLILQNNGDLVLRSTSGDSIWSTQTAGSDASLLFLGNDGVLALYDDDNNVLWSVNGDADDPDDDPDDDPPDSDGDLDKWSNYKLNLLPYTRTGDYQKIKYSGSKTGTTEFLILSSSHGNCGDVTKKQAKVKGGGWDQIVYAGNDDKAAEIWIRHVTSSNKNSLGEIDSNNAKAKLAILTYNDILNTGNVIEKKLLSRSSIAINSSGTGPFLIIAVSDNGQTSKMANEEYGTSDDRTFIYLTKDKSFKDSTAGKIRGAIASIQLK